MSTQDMHMLPAAPEGHEGSSNKRVLVAGALAAALALGGVGYFLLLGGGDEVDASVVPSARPAKTRTVKPAVAPAKKAPVTTVPAVAKAPLGRDPFRALYVVPAAGTGAATSTSTTPTTTTTGTSVTPGTTLGKEYPLKLTGVSRQGSGTGSYYTASFSVDGKMTTVLGGQRFGKYGELVVLGFSVDNKGKVIGVVLQVGDDSPLELLTGEKISVK